MGSVCEPSVCQTLTKHVRGGRRVKHSSLGLVRPRRVVPSVGHAALAVGRSLVLTGIRGQGGGVKSPPFPDMRLQLWSRGAICPNRRLDERVYVLRGARGAGEVRIGRSGQTAGR